ncbi:hypothetical protein EBR66_06545, partial [bacterium]|nr:hypothetical protein [bacterium]
MSNSDAILALLKQLLAKVDTILSRQDAPAAISPSIKKNGNYPAANSVMPPVANTPSNAPPVANSPPSNAPPV